MIVLCVYTYFFQPRKLGNFWNYFSITNLTNFSILLENFTIFSNLQNWEGEKENPICECVYNIRFISWNQLFLKNLGCFIMMHYHWWKFQSYTLLFLSHFSVLNYVIIKIVHVHGLCVCTMNFFYILTMVHWIL
jgi:hypothetical protein